MGFDVGRGNKGVGAERPGPAPGRCATRTALLGLLGRGRRRRPCRALRRLVDKAPGNSPMHGVLDEEAAEILPARAHSSVGNKRSTYAWPALGAKAGI